GSDQVTATVTRTNFSGTVNITVEGAPTGVTGSVSNVSASGNTTTATVTIAVDVATAPGTYTLSVKAAGDPAAPSTVSFALTVTVTAPPVGSYTLSASPDPVSIQQGANGPVTITIARTNFTGDVALSLVGAPTGVTAAFSPATLSGSTATSTLTITVGSTV